MSTNELEMKIWELRQLQQLIEEAQAEAEGIKDAIKAHMGDSEELRAGEYKGDMDARHILQAGPCGPENGPAGGSGPLHPHQHDPAFCRGMRKAPISQPTKARGYESPHKPP